MSIKTPQQIFNEIKGRVIEMNSESGWSNIVVSVGHDNKRLVALACKQEIFDQLINKENIIVDNYVCCRFYVVSRKTNDRYYTNANLLSIQKLSSQ